MRYAPAVFFVGASCVCGDVAVPDTLKPPAGAVLVVSAHAKGDQVYECRDAAWILRGPDATLFDADGEAVGLHFAGPTWEWHDHSQVTGKVAASAPAPDNDAVPWLLLNAAGHIGSGVMSRVTAIQRVQTKGGKPPAEVCDASQDGRTVRSAYEADYNFYAQLSPSTRNRSENERMKQ